MKVYFYHTGTGLPLPGVYELRPELVEANTPPGYAPWFGELNPATQRLDLTGGEPVVVDLPPDVDRLRREALTAVEAAAQTVERSEVPSPARAAIYAEKERQALAVLDALAIEAELPPHDLVERDMAVDGLTVEAAAEAIVAAAERLRAIAGPMEEWRRGRNAALNAASTAAEIAAIDVSRASLMAAIAAEQS